MIDIVLADDHKVVRKGLKALLGAEPDFNIVGEVENGQDAISLVEKIKPNILVLDMMMPGMNGLEVTRSLTSLGSKTGIVILSMQNCEAYISQALKFGARAYVLKEAPPEDLVKAIREVTAGRNYLCSSISENVLAQYPSSQENNSNEPYLRLTPREKEIMMMAVNGMCSKDIAAKLFLSIRTVETHRTNLMQKLEMHNQSQLVQYAMQIGINTSEPDSLKS